MTYLSTETPRFSINVLSQTIKAFVQEPAIAQIEQPTDASLEKASRILDNLVTGTTRLNPQNLLSRPEALAVAGLAVTTLAYAKFGVAGAGAVALLALAAGCNGDVNIGDCDDYPDVDGDGYGDENESTVCKSSFKEGISYIDNNLDCDDSTDTVNPGAAEICDGLDNNCDEVVDDSDPNVSGTSTWYQDGDTDGYGNPDISEEACSAPDGYVDNDDDCDDSDETVHEISPYYVDGDGDGYGGNVAQDLCVSSIPEGYSENSDDCDDGDNEINPDAEEECDEVDNDCDTVIDRSNNLTCLSTADFIFYGENTGDNSGVTVGNAGDVNNDGWGDILIGALGLDNGGTDKGGAYLINGPISSSSTREIELSTVGSTQPGARFLGESSGDYVTSGGIPAGNVDGDNYDDVLISAYGYNNYTGAVYLIYGPLSGDILLENIGNLQRGVKIIGNAIEHRTAAGGGVDLGGDGYGDILISSYKDNTSADVAGVTALFFGASSTDSDYLTGEVNVSDADSLIYGENESDYSGVTLTPVRDANGNGSSDVLIGAYGYDSTSINSGAVYLVDGDWFLSNPLGQLSDVGTTIPGAKLLGELAGDYAGGWVSDAGDVDGDGNGDFLIGAYYADSFDVDAGSVYLVYGGPDLTGTFYLSDIIHGASIVRGCEIYGVTANDLAGRSVSGGKDVNGDGYDDIVVGVINHDEGGTDAGAAFLFYGAPITDTAYLEGQIPISDADMRLIGKGSGDNAGISVSLVDDQGGDGKADILIGAYNESSAGTAAGATYLVLSDGL